MTEIASTADLARRWLELDQNPETSAEIQTLVDRAAWPELEERLRTPLTFGTAGLRAAMGAGFSRMNDLTVIQATQGVCTYLLEAVAEAASRGVVIGYDHRHHSKDFALLTAAAFLHRGVKVYLYDVLVHTPLVPFAIQHFGAAAGVMVTASHNPKDDNGYKLYWSNACQVISPHDKHIQAAIEQNQVPWTWDKSVAEKKAVKIETSISDLYFQRVSSLATSRAFNQNTPVKIVYTPMHGVGLVYAQRAFEAFGLSAFTAVDQQMRPDPDFPTVKYPNPEEGKGALQLAMNTAETVGARVILANDPDADRLAVAEQQDGEWHIFSGNQIGVLLAHYIWTSGMAKNDNVAMLASTVSSKMLQRMAKVEGFRFEETLTGFKWLGNRAKELAAQGLLVAFAYEEAIGYMVGDIVYDKDGISALAVIAELVAKLYRGGSTLRLQLEKLYETYGYYSSNNGYFICHKPDIIRRMFERIRSMSSSTPGYPLTIGEFRVDNVRDLTTGYDSSTSDKKTTLPTSRSSQMLTFHVTWLRDASFTATLTLRTSGTEPKIKYYSEMRGEWAKRAEVDACVAQLVAVMSEVLLEPSKNGLV